MRLLREYAPCRRIHPDSARMPDYIAMPPYPICTANHQGLQPSRFLAIFQCAFVAGIAYIDRQRTTGVNALLGDGRVRFAGNGISQTAWQGLGSMAGGETDGSDW